MNKLHTFQTIEEYSQYLRLKKDFIPDEVVVYKFEQITQGNFRWHTNQLKTLFYQLSFNELFKGNIIKDGNLVDASSAFIGFVSPLHTFHIQGEPNFWRGYSILFSLDFAEFSLWNSMTRKDFPFIFEEDAPALNLTKRHKIRHYKAIFEEMFEIFRGNNQQKQELLRKKLFSLLMKLKDDFPIREKESFSNNEVKDTAVKFIKLVNEHFLDHHKTNFYTDTLLISQDQLYYSVKKYWGVSPLEVIQSKLINEAKLLIHHTNLNISDIAYQLNFQELAHFSRFFKSHTGLSPKSFKPKY